MHNTVKKHTIAILAAMAGLSSANIAQAQFGPGPFDEISYFIDALKSPSHSAISKQLTDLNFGSLPAEVNTVISNVKGYLNAEKGINADLVSKRDSKQKDVNDLQKDILTRSNRISDLIAANPLDSQIATEQAVLASQQEQFAILSSELSKATSAVTNSDIKISLYNSAIDGPVKTAEKAAIDEAKKINDARDQYVTGGDRTLEKATATGNAGLQSVVDAIKGVTAGDQAPVIAALQTADTEFATTGAANATIADIQKLVKTINDKLPTLPSISENQQAEALTLVLNGSYERNAIDTIQSSGIAGIVHRDPVTGAVHIGENSLITNEVGGVQVLYAQNGAAAPININVTNGSDLLVNGVSVATDADVNAEEAARIAADNVLTTNLAKEVTDRIADVNAEEAARIAADNVLTTNLAKEVTDRAAADTVLDGKIAKEVTDRIADVNAEEAARIAAVNAEAATRASADTTLQANIDAETSRATAAEGLLTTNLTKEVADRVAAVNTEKNRALAAESALANRATALEGRATALEGRVGRAEGRINSLRKGVSMAAALQTPVIEAGKQNAVKAGVATVDGAQGFGIAVARRINESVQVNLDVATDFETDTAARAGVNYSF